MAATSTTAALHKNTGVTTQRQTPVVPLDYSFMGLTSLSEMQQHDPVSGAKSSIRATGLTTRSGGDFNAPTDAIISTRTGAITTPKKRHAPMSLRVNNNNICHLNDMHEALCAVFEHPGALQWLDISGNQLESIPPQVFSAYPELFTLHLHGNLLRRYSDIDALAKWLPRLHSITLHGNPLEDKKHYRNYVIASFPNLKQLNFSPVTIGDRDKAETWTRIYKKALNDAKGRREDDDE